MVRLDSRIETSGLWPDFHHTMIGAIRTELMRVVPSNYVALVEERVYIAWEGNPLTSYHRPDISIVEVPPTQVAPPEPSEDVVTTTPVIVPVALRDEVHEYSVAIRTVEGELITAIELLSPANKRPGHEGNASYMAKRQEPPRCEA